MFTARAEQGSGNAQDFIEKLKIGLQKLDICIPECLLGRANTDAPMIPCGLCEGWFHIRCLGLPDGGGPSCIRGLYFCRDCLSDLRELRLLTKPRREQEARFEAMESLVAALDAEQALLKELLNRSAISLADVVVRVDGRVVTAAYAALLRETAGLKRNLADHVKSVGGGSGQASGRSDPGTTSVKMLESQAGVQEGDTVVEKGPMPALLVRRSERNSGSNKNMGESCDQVTSGLLEKNTQYGATNFIVEKKGTVIRHVKKKNRKRSSVSHGMTPHLSRSKQHQKSYSCSQCKESFSVWFQKQRHLKDVHGIMQVYFCSVCQVQYDLIRQVKNHVSERKCEGLVTKRYVPAGPPSAGVCDNPCARLRISSRRHDTQPSVAPKKRFRCSHCGKMYMNSGVLLRHIRISHPAHAKVTQVESWSCSECGVKFKNKGALARHVSLGCCKRNIEVRQTRFQRQKLDGVEWGKNHESAPEEPLNIPDTTGITSLIPTPSKRNPKLKGSTCGTHEQVNDVASSLKGLGPSTLVGEVNNCHVCSSSFAQTGHLLDHLLQVHMIDALHSCSVCDKLFSLRRELRSHAITQHGGFSGSDYKFLDVPLTDYVRCRICPRLFASKRTLQRHLRKSHSIRGSVEEFNQFQCQECGIHFQTISAITRHTTCDCLVMDKGLAPEKLADKPRGEPQGEKNLFRALEDVVDIVEVPVDAIPECESLNYEEFDSESSDGAFLRAIKVERIESPLSDVEVYEPDVDECGVHMFEIVKEEMVDEQE